MGIVLLSFVVACSNSSSESQGKGDEGANAGNVEAQDIQLSLQNLVIKVEKMKVVFPEINLESLKDVVQTVKIFYRDKTYSNGFETDAINDGKSTIAINKSRWRLIYDDSKKNALLLHELLGILGLEKDNYSISSRLRPEYRFLSNSQYTCTSVVPDQEQMICLIELGYNPTSQRKIFLVKSNNCYFPSSAANFNWYFDFYSANASCTEGTVENPGTCNTHSNDGRSWNALYFNDDGVSFYFRGYKQLQLNCQKN